MITNGVTLAESEISCNILWCEEEYREHHEIEEDFHAKRISNKSNPLRESLITKIICHLRSFLLKFFAGLPYFFGLLVQVFWAGFS